MEQTQAAPSLGPQGTRPPGKCHHSSAGRAQRTWEVAPRGWGSHPARHDVQQSTDPSGSLSGRQAPGHRAAHAHHPPPPPRLALPRLQASLLKPTAVSRWGLGTRATLRPHFSGRPPPPKPVTPGTPPPPKDRGAGRSNPSRRGAPRWARPWGVPDHASSGRSPDRLRPREAGPPHSARRTQAGRQQPSVGGRPAGSPRLLLNGDKGQRARVGGGPCGGAGHGHFRPESAPRSTNRRPLSSRRAASPAGLRTPACPAPVVRRLPGAVVPLPRLACTCRR